MTSDLQLVAQCPHQLCHRVPQVCSRSWVCVRVWCRRVSIRILELNTRSNNGDVFGASNRSPVSADTTANFHISMGFLSTLPPTRKKWLSCFLPHALTLKQEYKSTPPSSQNYTLQGQLKIQVYRDLTACSSYNPEGGRTETLRNVGSF
jgi:hypothetical protein